MRIPLPASAAGLALAMSIALPSHATETIKAVVIDGYPAKSMWVQEFSDFFIPQVDQKLAVTGNYAFDWQESYGGAIVKPRGVLDGISLGLGDIGIVTTIFHSSKLPSQALSAVTPFVSSDAPAVARAIDEISREFPTMQNEFAKQNQVYLATGVVLDSYQLFSREPLNTLTDLQGEKVAGAGMNMRYLEGVDDAVGVRGGLTDFYNMLQTGMVDQAMLWPEAAATFKIAEVAPHMLSVDLGAVNTKTVTVNADYWEKLPEEVKGVLQEVAIEYRDHLASLAMEKASASLAAFEQAGGNIVELSQEDRAAWAAAMPNLALEWASDLDAAGEPGSQMLRAYMGKLAEAGFTPVRDWTADLPSE